MSEKKRKKRIIIGVIIILLIVTIVTAILIIMDQKRQKDLTVGSGVTGEDHAEEIEYNGKTYKINNSVMSILLIGVDSNGPLKVNSHYGEAGQADSVGMIILDKEKKTIRILPISRDTMTKVNTYTDQGYQNGSQVTHLGFAYTFGDGGRDSCKNTCLAVSDLLKSVKVHYYAAMSMDYIADLNELFGRVTVTVPNNDIAHLHPECTTGAVVTLDASNVSDFIRHRDTAVNFSNNGRMARNRAYYEGAIQKIKSMSEDEVNGIWEKIQKEDNTILTSFSMKQYLELMAYFKEFNYDASTGSLSLAGTDKVTDGRDAFYADEAAMEELVVKTFYVEKK